MKIFALIFFFVFAFANCKTAQTQQIAENKSQPTPTASIVSVNVEGEEIGYPRYTTSDKQYLGCWRSIEASEVVNYKLKFFRLTEKTIQTSKMSKPIAYNEAESNNYKDYFVLKPWLTLCEPRLYHALATLLVMESVKLILLLLSLIFPIMLKALNFRLKKRKASFYVIKLLNKDPKILMMY